MIFQDFKVKNNVKSLIYVVVFYTRKNNFAAHIDLSVMMLNIIFLRK